MPRGSLTVVPGAGHVLHEERPGFAAAFALAAAERAGIVAGAPATSGTGAAAPDGAGAPPAAPSR
jgi:hypothetical protein